MIYHAHSCDFELAKAELVGGKGANLIWLQKNKIKTADFIIATTDTYRYWIQNRVLPLSFSETLEKWLNTKASEHFAVRSSFALEDGAENSFAGIMDTFLYTPKEKIIDKIVECFKSANSLRAQEYLNKKEIKDESMAAVVIQEMVASVSSGVLFSRSPVGNSSYIEIDAGWGLGEGVVAGTVEVDHYTVDRFGEIINSQIQKKISKVFYDPEVRLVKEMEVAKERQDISCLDYESIKALTSQALMLEQLYQSPVDIEWATTNSDIYILQIRPITKKFPKLNYYTDINLIESYPGVSSPFTGSIIPILYNKVFLESAHYFGFNKKRMNQLKLIYKNLISDINHHLYYNLNSYYTALYSLPGGEKNIENWHKMIGGKADGIPRQIELEEFNFYERVKCLANIAKYFIFKGFYLGNFYKKSELTRSYYKDKIINAQNARECTQILKEMIKEIEGFGLTIINDLHIMIFLGMVEKKIKDPQELSNLLKTNEKLESLEPIIKLRSFFKISKKTQNFTKAFSELAQNDFITYDQIFEKLQSEYPVEIKEIRKYLQKFGNRSFEELKFESLSFEESPKIFSEFLTWYQDISAMPINDISEDHIEISKKSLLVKALYSCIKDREHSRLTRGQFYSLIRKAFLRIIYFLRENKTFENYGLYDFFSLTFDDLMKFNSGDLDISDLKEIIDQKKGWEKNKDDFPEFFCAEENQTVFKFSSEIAEVPKLNLTDHIQGLGVSPGKIQGKALVINSPREVYQYKDLSEYILVTKTTDPAWVFIMTQCKGLVSEKGSLLSHTAIIGRELEIPTVVGAKESTKKILLGDLIEIDGESGIIKKL